MEGQPSPESTIKTLPIICVSFMALIVLLVVIIKPQIEFREEAQGFDYMTLVGFASLLAGLMYAQFKLRPINDGSRIEDLPPVKFQTDTLISLALIELCALLGIFMVRDQVMSTAMPVAALVAIALFVLPHVLQYTKAVKDTGR